MKHLPNMVNHKTPIKHQEWPFYGRTTVTKIKHADSRKILNQSTNRKIVQENRK